MPAAVPIILPPGGSHPLGFRPPDYPSEVSQVWDAATMTLNDDVFTPITRDSFAADIGPSALVEIHLAKTVRNQPTTPVTMWLKSTNATDKQPIEVMYIDHNNDLIEAIFLLNGTTPVELPLMYRCLAIEHAGSTAMAAYLTALGLSGFNISTTLGDVSVYWGAGTGLPAEVTTLQWFPAAYPIDANMKVGKSMDSSFTVPRGFTAYAFGFEAVLGKNDEIFFSIETRTPGGPWLSRVPLQIYENEFTRQSKPRAIPELFDLRVLAKSSSGAADVPVSFNYQLMMIRNGENL